jgi:bacterial/archaeal transporter family protein
MPASRPDWLMWAVLSACFAALTAVFAKVGVKQINPDVATLYRTFIILIVLGTIVAVRGQFQAVGRPNTQTFVFLTLSGLATGASWICYFRALSLGDAARVAPVDKLSVVLVAIFGVTFLGERLSVINWMGIALIASGAWLVTI